MQAQPTRHGNMQERIEWVISQTAKLNGALRRDMRLVISPYRICPLGAHIDHQDGLVTGLAIDRAVVMTFTPRQDRCVRMTSHDFGGVVEFELDAVPSRQAGDWGNYVRGAVLALQQHHHLKAGMDAVVAGSMPIGGLSSSAAVGIACLLALEHVNDLNITPEENIALDRFIENGYLGLNNGILDQSTILLSDRQHLTSLDCRAVTFEKIPLPHSVELLDITVVHSGVDRALIGTDYNNRVAECREAARAMLELAGLPAKPIPLLRDVPDEVYGACADRLPEPLNRRARHFFDEMERVRQGILAWRAGDLASVGRLIVESGASSIENYQCGSPQLIALYRILRDTPGVYGTRFSGAGFRGACIALSDPTVREDITARVSSLYPKARPDMAERYSIHFCRPDNAARLEVV